MWSSSWSICGPTSAVARRLAEGTLELHGMYFHVGEAQAYLLTSSDAEEVVVRARPSGGPGERVAATTLRHTGAWNRTKCRPKSWAPARHLLEVRRSTRTRQV